MGDGLAFCRYFICSWWPHILASMFQPISFWWVAVVFPASLVIFLENHRRMSTFYTVALFFCFRPSKSIIFILVSLFFSIVFLVLVFYLQVLRICLFIHGTSSDLRCLFGWLLQFADAIPACFHATIIRVCSRSPKMSELGASTAYLRGDVFLTGAIRICLVCWLCILNDKLCSFIILKYGASLFHGIWFACIRMCCYEQRLMLPTISSTSFLSALNAIFHFTCQSSGVHLQPRLYWCRLPVW